MTRLLVLLALVVTVAFAAWRARWRADRVITDSYRRTACRGYCPCDLTPEETP